MSTYTTAMLTGVADIVLLAAGTVFLSVQFGWQTGVGVACLVAFHKAANQYT